MKIILAAEIAQLCGVQASSNVESFAIALKLRGTLAGLNRPARLVACLAQLSHESVGFKYDKEIWGPTAAQKRYDTRTDLGNSPEADGDGKLYAGRGPIQVTGKTNYRLFRDWCRTLGIADVPDFVAKPDLLNTDPWEGLSVLWFWETNKLNSYVDARDLTGLSKRINGGTNGLADRLQRFGQIGIRFLGAPNVREFQATHGLHVDGVIGPLTRAKIFERLEAQENVTFTSLISEIPEAGVKRPSLFRSLIRLLLSLFERKAS